jgi:hypothetical protein
VRLALADALWRRNLHRDRERARLLAATAHDEATSFLEKLAASDPLTPVYRRKYERTLDAITAWQAAHR